MRRGSGRGSSTRSGFSISPLIILLVLALAGLLAWRGSVMVSRIPPRGSMGHRPGYSIGVVVGNVALGLVCVAVAGGVGLFAYFVSRKSEAAANAAIAGTLLLPIGLFSYQGVRVLTREEPPTTGTRAMEPPAEMLRPRAAPKPSTPTRPPPPVVPEEASRPEPRERPEEKARVAPARPIPRTGEFAEVARFVVEEAGAGQVALLTLAASLQAEVDALEASVRMRVEDDVKTPRPHRGELRKRKERFEALGGQARVLASRLDALGEEAAAALSDAGLGQAEAERTGVHYAGMARAIVRRSACDDIARFADDGAEQSDALDVGYGQWKVGAGGGVETDDFALRARVAGPTMRLRSFGDRLDRVCEQIHGR